MIRFDQKQSAFGYALLLYIVIVVVLITFIPFEFRIPDKIQFFQRKVCFHFPLHRADCGLHPVGLYDRANARQEK